MPEINLLHCPHHHRSWQSDGTDAVQSCPWCEIERLRAQLAAAEAAAVELFRLFAMAATPSDAEWCKNKWPWLVERDKKEVRDE